MAGTIKADTWLNDDGSENYKCRAWVNFNGTGTVAIRASGNVSSITDNAAGDYTVNLTTAMPDVDFCMLATSKSDGPGTGFIIIEDNIARTTSSVEVLAIDDAGGTNDSTIISVAIFR